MLNINLCCGSVLISELRLAWLDSSSATFQVMSFNLSKAYMSPAVAQSTWWGGQTAVCKPAGNVCELVWRGFVIFNTFHVLLPLLASSVSTESDQASVSSVFDLWKQHLSLKIASWSFACAGHGSYSIFWISHWGSTFWGGGIEDLDS